MLYLNATDIVKSADRNQVMDAIEKAYAIDLSGEYTMPPRMYVNRADNTLLYMPCFTNSIFGTKMLSLFPGNAEKKQPVIQGLVVLNDPETGRPLAILDGAKLTAIRTGAVGGVGVRHTTARNAGTVGLIGAGVQGFQQILFACAARNIKQVNIYDLCKEKLAAFAENLSKALPEVRIEIAASVHELLEASNIVITATPVTSPVLPDNQDLLKNKNYIGIGSYKPEMREFPQALYKLVSKVYIDTKHGLDESGDLITPLEKGWVKPNQIIKLGEAIGSISSSETENTTLFKSVGMALFDMVVAELIYNNALQNNIGTMLD